MSKTTTPITHAFTLILLLGLSSAGRPLYRKDVRNTPQFVVPPFGRGSGVGFDLGWASGWPWGGHAGIGVGPNPWETGIDIGWGSGWPWGGHIGFGFPGFPLGRYAFPYPFPPPGYSDPRYPCPWCAPHGIPLPPGTHGTPTAGDSPKPVEPGTHA